MTPTPAITCMLRIARNAALAQMSGQPATLGPGGTLEKLAAIMRDVVIAQAAAGLWRDHGIVEPSDLRGLRVSCTFGDVSRGEAPIRTDWDFSRTRLASLVVRDEVDGGRA
jgi:hypothetical protein